MVHRSHSPVTATITLLATIILTSAVASAETIYLVGGKTVTGTVENSGADSIIVHLSGGGTLALSRDSVARIEKGTAPEDELEKMEKEMVTGDSKALFEVASWCQEKGLPEDAERLLWQTLEVSPDHAEAREKLGWVRSKGAWFQEGDARHLAGEFQVDGAWTAYGDWAHEVASSQGEAFTKAKELFETAASTRGSKASRAKAIEEFRTFPADVRVVVLRGALIKKSSRVRQLAIREIGGLAQERHRPLLSHVAVVDSSKGVRNEALLALRDLSDPDVALSFVPYLASNTQEHRVAATQALSVFPDRRAVGPLVESLQTVWAGFGRVHFAQLVQRSYVKDYELVSGGTGLVVQEVADPVVDTFMEGVVLDVDVRRVISEGGARAAALQRSTGRSYASDFAAWERWWAANAGKRQLASKSSEGAAGH